MDMVGLYPHISHDEGLETMGSVLSEYNRNIGIDGGIACGRLDRFGGIDFKK